MTAGSDMAHRIAAHFLAARKAARGFAHYPGDVPDTLANAYAIQDAALAQTTDAIAGWKVGRIRPPLSDQYGCDRLAGPILVHGVAPATPDARAPIFADGFGAIEAEYLFRIGKAPEPGQRDFTPESALDLVDAVHIGVEIASSPFAEINAMGPATTISDFGNNNGLLVGPAIAGWRDGRYADQMVVTRIDGQEVGSGTASAFPRGAIGSVSFILENLVARGIAIQPGWWISTGAVTGVHPVSPGQRVEMDFGPFGMLHCRIEVQEPR